MTIKRVGSPPAQIGMVPSPNPLSVADRNTGSLATIAGLGNLASRVITNANKSPLALSDATGAAALVPGADWGGSTFGPYGFTVADTLAPNTLSTQFTLTVVPAAGLGPYISASGLLLALAFRRVVSGYSGPGIQITRVSDGATLNVAFNANNDELNYAAINTFIGNAYQPYFVTRIYDQSGTGAYASAPLASAPSTASTPFNLLGRTRPVFGNNVGGPGANNSTGYTLPALTLPWQSGTVYWAGNLQSSLQAGRFWTVGSTNPIYLSTDGAIGSVNMNSDVYNGSREPTLPRTQPSCMAQVFSASNRLFYRDEKVWTRTAFGNASSTGTGYLLNYNGSANCYGDFSGFAVYNVQHTQAQVTANQAVLAPQAVRGSTRQIVCDGDSIMFGSVIEDGRSFMKYADRKGMFSQPVDIFNLGSPGRTVATVNSNFSPGAGAMYDATNYTKSVYIQQAVTNDINGGVTGANAWNNSALPALQAAKTKGFKTLQMLMLPRGSGLETERTNFNNLAKAAVGGGVLDAVIDGSTVATGAVGAASNSTLFADGTHPTELGGSLLAPVVAAAVNPFL